MERNGISGLKSEARRVFVSALSSPVFSLGVSGGSVHVSEEQKAGAMRTHSNKRYVHHISAFTAKYKRWGSHRSGWRPIIGEPKVEKASLEGRRGLTSTDSFFIPKGG